VSKQYEAAFSLRFLAEDEVASLTRVQLVVYGLSTEIQTSTYLYSFTAVKWDVYLQW